MSGNERWSCLMYHATPSADHAASTDYYGVHATSLEAQLRVLAEAGLVGQSLEACVEQDAPRGCVALTFDDAHVSNYEVALPLFRRYQATATIFVISRWVGREGYCTWEQLREMADAGWSIQSHTASHPFLSMLSDADARTELHESRETIEANIGQPVRTIALPNGDRPRAPLRALLDETGYRWAATSKWGPNGARERQLGLFNRYTVRRDTSMARFASIAAARSGYGSVEGMRLTALSQLRGLLGPAQYNRLRSMVLRKK